MVNKSANILGTYTGQLKKYVFMYYNKVLDELLDEKSRGRKGFLSTNFQVAGGHYSTVLYNRRNIEQSCLLNVWNIYGILKRNVIEKTSEHFWQ